MYIQDSPVTNFGVLNNVRAYSFYKMKLIIVSEKQQLISVPKHVIETISLRVAELKQVGLFLLEIRSGNDQIQIQFCINVNNFKIFNALS